MPTAGRPRQTGRAGGAIRPEVTIAKHPRQLLLLAFGPFPGAPRNPTPALATALARRLEREARPRWRTDLLVLPVEWSVADRFQTWLREEARGRYRAALALGLGRGSRELRACSEIGGLPERLRNAPLDLEPISERPLMVETRAVNLAEAARVDTAGASPAARALVEDAPVALFGVLHRPPFDRALRSAQDAGHPLAESADAGRYLCNAVFYHLLLARAAGWLAPDGPVGFVHVPPIRGLTGERGRGLDALSPSRALDALSALAQGLLAADDARRR